MNAANRNMLWATIVAEELHRSGVRTICASPGSRSTPLIAAFAAHPGLEMLVHIDERSGSFFALGHAKRQSSPVALLCTSGTAAANYYPAAIEAFYSGVPLVILTADRPPELRDCGAGQTIDQIKLYGDRVRYFFEIGTPVISEFQLRHLRSLVSHAVAVATGVAEIPAGPVHLNFAFADPLTPIYVPNDVPEDLAVSSPLAWYGRGANTGISPPYSGAIAGQRILSTEAIATIANQITSCPRGAIAIGVYDAPAGFDLAVQRLAQVTGYPLLAESTGLDRSNSTGMTSSRAIGRYDSFLRSAAFASSYAPELVIRFGAMPTSKHYQLWLEQHIQCQQFVVGDGRNSDPTHGLTQLINAHATVFCEQLADYLDLYALPGWQDKLWRSGFEHAEAIAAVEIDHFLAATDILFEGKVFAELAQWLPKDVGIYIASSTPIRDLDTFFQPRQYISVLANRGANGIDGTVSSALGAAWRSEQPMILVCGDLAFYHDLNGLMAVKQYHINLTIILLNNNGGGIFELLPIANFEPPFEQFFGTPHGLDFAPIVTAYGCSYEQIQDWTHFQTAVLESLRQPGTQVLEVKSDRKRDKQLRQNLWQSIATAVDQHFS